MLLTPVGGLLLDRFGSLPLVLLPGLAMAALAYPLWALLSMHGSVLAALEGQAGLCVIMAVRGRHPRKRPGLVLRRLTH